MFLIGDVAEFTPQAQAMADPKKIVVQVSYDAEEHYCYDHYSQTSVLEPVLLLNRLRSSNSLSEALHLDLKNDLRFSKRADLSLGDFELSIDQTFEVSVICAQPE